MKTLFRGGPLLVLVLGLLPAGFAAISPTSTITAVTVYTDRAVVTRMAVVDVNAAGPTDIVFERLPAALLTDSLQVASSGTVPVTILDVSAQNVVAAHATDERVQALQDEIQAIQTKRNALADQGAVLKDQGAALDRIEIAGTPNPTRDSPHFSFDDAGKLLVFLAERRGRLASDQRSLDAADAALARQQTAVEDQLAQLRADQGNIAKSVTLHLNAAGAGRLNLVLTYAVPDASWSPRYDARMVSTEKAVQLGCFGEVRQSTGEDWKDVALTLSTARPALGGAPAPLSTWVVDVASIHPQPMYFGALRFDKDALAANSTLAGTRVRDEAVPAVVAGRFLQAGVTSAVTSASFSIPIPASVPSDGSVHLVPITTLRLDAVSEYTAIPKQIKAAFLTAHVVNTSDYPLLSGQLNVFLDTAFVATSRLITVMPGEKFDLALGADEGIAVDRKLDQRLTEETGLLSKKRRITYAFTLTLKNHKPVPATVVLIDQVPVSRNEKIVVTVLAPVESENKPTSDGTLKWTVSLQPGETKEVPLRFTVEYPEDLPVMGLD